MQKIIYAVFKILALTIIAIFLTQLGTYLMRVYTITEKAEIILNSMQNEVSRNNYLTEGAYNSYTAMLDDLQSQFAGYVDIGGATDTSFIVKSEINYNTDADGDFTGDDVVYSTDLAKPASYGDIAVVQVKIYIRKFTFMEVYHLLISGDKFDRTPEEIKTAYDKQTMNDKPMTFTCQVPCLKYVAVGE